MTNDFEFETMRQQMQTLRKKLDRQEIVNDRVMRRSMKKNVSGINYTYNALIVLALLMLPYSYWAFVKLSSFSVAFWLGTCLFMLICAGATYYNGKDLRDRHLMDGDLLSVRRKMARAKKFDSQWLFFGIPMALAWLGWFYYETTTTGNSYLAQGLFWGGCIGAVVGGVFGLLTYNKTQRQYQAIIEQIEELTSE